MEFHAHWWQLWLIINIVLIGFCIPVIKDDFKDTAYVFRWVCMIFGTIIFWFLYIVFSLSFG